MNLKELQVKQEKMKKKIMLTGSQHTKTKYNTAFNNFNQFLKEYQITELTNTNIDDIIIDYLTYLKGGLAPEQESKLSNNTINQYMILINKLLTKECKLEVENIKQLKTQKKEPKYISIKQYDIIQRHLANNYTMILLMQKEKQKKNKQCSKVHQLKTIQTDKTIINLLFYTGLRVHEALKITIKEILQLTPDADNNYQLKVIGKGSKQRTIIINPCTYALLKGYIESYTKPGQTYIFESNKTPGKPLSTMTIERHFNRIAKELDMQNSIDPTDAQSYTTLLKPHNLRHSYAVTGLNNGLPINAMQKLLGHSSITTTQIYTELNDDDLSNAVSKAFMIGE